MNACLFWLSVKSSQWKMDHLESGTGGRNFPHPDLAAHYSPRASTLKENHDCLLSVVLSAYLLFSPVLKYYVFQVFCEGT